jgi:hypothetical protein
LKRARATSTIRVKTLGGKRERFLPEAGRDAQTKPQKFGYESIGNRLEEVGIILTH